MADGNKLGAAPLRTALDVTLTKDELEYVAAFLTDDAESDDDAVRLLLGDGHSGYGLYAAHPEYPEEGAILVKNLPAPAGVAVVPEGYEKMRGGKPVSYWRDNALEAAAGIAEAYNSHPGVAADIRAMKSTSGVTGTSNDQGENHG